MSYCICLIVLVFITINAYAVPENGTDFWGGKWFPRNPEAIQQNSELNDLFGTNNIDGDNKENWAGKWFPSSPAGKTVSKSDRHKVVKDVECDDGKTNIGVDFDPEDKRHSFYYLCMDHKSKYEPKFATSPILREYIVPPVFKAPSVCLNKTIEYEERLPTFGAHRNMYPKHGEYKFLPIQRWMHSLEHGAIVMLYHPCANQMQVEKLRNTLNACLYRHVITPSTVLLPELPLALVAWGKSLEMSVVDVSTVVDFIKENAKNGPQSIQYDRQEYDACLLAEAKLVTDESDSQICANINL